MTNTMEDIHMSLISLCCYFITALDDENSERNMLIRNFDTEFVTLGSAGSWSVFDICFSTLEIPRALWNYT